MSLIHHVVVSIGDDFFKMVCQEFPSHIESNYERLCGMGRNRLTADQMTLPFTIGVIWVNEKPESTTRTHSDMERVPRT
jgi:hypothetical protein